MRNSGATPAAWLLSSAGRRGSLVRLLQDEPLSGGATLVVATDMSSLSAAGRLADVFELVPEVTDPGFIQRVLEIAIRNNVRVIIPTIDPEIELFAAHRDEFAAHGVEVWVSSPEVAQLGRDKWAFYNWLIDQGFPTVETHEVVGILAGELQGPVIAKPRSGSSGIGVVFADSVDGLDLESLDASYIVQSRAPGFEVTVDFAVGHGGRLLAVVPRRRIEIRGGEVSKGVTVDYPAVIGLVRSLSAALPGAYGALNVQVFYEPKSESLNIIEINPRFGGGYPLSHLAGANFLDALLRDSRDEVVDELRWSPGTLMLRYDCEVIIPDFDFRSLDG